MALAGARTVMVLESIFETSRLHHALVGGSRKARSVTDNAHELGAEGASLQDQVLKCLLANFSLWAKTPPEFQFGVVTTVLDMIRESPDRLRGIVSVESVLASIRTCFPHFVSDEAGDGLDPTATPVMKNVECGDASACPSAMVEAELTAEREWTSMVWRERQHMRGFLWEMVRLLVGREVSQQDGDSLILFMANCDDAQLVSRWRMNEHDDVERRIYQLPHNERQDGSQRPYFPYISSRCVNLCRCLVCSCANLCLQVDSSRRWKGHHLAKTERNGVGTPLRQVRTSQVSTILRRGQDSSLALLPRQLRDAPSSDTLHAAAREGYENRHVFFIAFC